MPENGDKEIELSDAEVTNNNGVVDKVPVSFRDKIRAYTNFITVEPFILCYILPNVLTSSALQNFNIEKACRSDLYYSQDICSAVISGNSTEHASDQSHNLVAKMTAWTQPLESGIPAIVILFIGAWSDRTGNRKTLMLTPMLGEFISVIGLILSTYYFIEWPLLISGLIISLPTALSGGFTVALMGSYSYIADVTTPESRTFRIGCVAMVITLLLPIATTISGVLTKSVGYYGVFGIATLLYAFGLIYTIFRIHDVRNVPIEGTLSQKILVFFNPKNAWDTISLLILSPKRQLIHIWLLICVHIVVLGPVVGEQSVMYFYAQKKFGFDIVDFTLFMSYTILVGLAGSATAVLLFSKFLQMHDALIGVIAASCKIFSSCAYGFAPNRIWFYAASLFDFFGAASSIAVRSMATKVVTPENVGKMCSLIALAEALLRVVYTPLYSILYAKTATVLPETFLFIGGLMTCPAIFIFIALYIMYRKQQKDVVKNPDSKAMYAHENVVTVM